MMFTANQYFFCKKFVRTITLKSFKSPSMPILYDLKILKLYGVFNLKLFIYVYELVNMISSVFFHNQFESVSFLSI